eukprot:COSAG02_NODE_477_length_21523_cov_11.763163_6_plen_210_part_00
MELQCDACLLVLEDIWNLLLYQPDPVAGEAPLGFEYSLIENVQKMCGDPYDREGPRGNVARWVGLHNIYNCTKDGISSVDADECRARSKDTGYHIERENPVDDVVAQHVDAVMTRAKDPDRAWHVGVYSMLCQMHLAPALPEIAVAFEAHGGIPPAKWKDAAKRSDARKAQQRVAASACELMCADKQRAKPKRKSQKKAGKSGRGKTPP